MRVHGNSRSRVGPTELSQRHLQRIKDDQVRGVQEDTEAIVPKEARGVHWLDWAQTLDNQGPWKSESDGQFLVFYIAQAL